MTVSKHLHKIGILPSPNCLLCSKEEEMTLDHLLNCEELKLIEDITSIVGRKKENDFVVKSRALDTHTPIFMGHILDYAIVFN